MANGLGLSVIALPPVGFAVANSFTCSFAILPPLLNCNILWLGFAFPRRRSAAHSGQAMTLSAASQLRTAKPSFGLQPASQFHCFHDCADGHHVSGIAHGPLLSLRHVE